EILCGRRLVEGQSDATLVDLPKIDLARFRVRVDPSGVHARNDQRIKVSRVYSVTEATKSLRHHGGHSMDSFRDRLDPLRAMVNRIHARHDSEKYLRGADIRSRFAPTNMLFGRMQSESNRIFSHSVLGNADDSPRHQSLIGVVRREIGRVRAAI